MKALKEKRIGVRSLLRRGLIILSLFALVFAVACGGDDSGSPSTPGTDVPGTDNPPPAARTITDIVVLKQPTEVSFQGLPPDLTGLVAVIYWSDGTSETVTDPTNFVGVPAYCDVPGKTGNTIDKIPTTTSGGVITAWGDNPEKPETNHAIAYAGHTEKTASIVIPWVVPLLQTDVPDEGKYALQLTGAAKKVWRSDEIPNFSGLKLEAMYEDYKKADGTLMRAQKKEIPITATYPQVCGLEDFNASTHPVLSLGIGYNDPTLSLDNVTAYDRVVSFNIEKFVKASGITVDATSTFADYFDDDLKLAGVNAPAGYDLLKDLSENNNIMLRVSYFDPDVEARTIPFSEYLTNMNFYNSRRATKIDEVAGSDGITSQYAGRIVAAGSPVSKPEYLDILNYSEDDESGLPYFNVVMNYVPSIWGEEDHAITGDDSWVDQFDIPIPLYTFSVVEATRKDPLDTSNVRVVAEADGTAIPTQVDWKKTPASTVHKGDHLMQALTAKWELTGTYERGAEQRTKKMALTPIMFADGLKSAPQTQATVGVIAETFVLNKLATGYDWTVNGGLKANDIGRGYLLPVWYRGERLNDPEFGGVVVDLVGP